MVANTAEPTESPAPDAESTLNDLFAAAPKRAQHFLALLCTRDEVLMPEVMTHLGLVRPKAVGGAVEPIQRLSRSMGVPLPFEADFAESGFKRWRWVGPKLEAVPESALAPLPAPTPTPKRTKKKGSQRRQTKYNKPVTKDDYKKWGKARAKAARKAEKARQARARRAATAAPAAPDRQGAPPRRGPADGRRPPVVERTRRRRFDRPMPEVFRRAGRPGERPPPRVTERRGYDRPRYDDRPARGSQWERPVRPPRTPREERPVERAATPAAATPAADAPVSSAPVSSAPVSSAPVSNAPVSSAPAPTPTPAESPAAPPVSEPAAHPPRVEARPETPRVSHHNPEERLPMPRSGPFRRRTMGDTDVPVVVIRRRKR